MKRCIEYLRVSTVHQRDNLSLESQRNRADAFAAGQGWVVVDRVEEAHTATELERPELMKLQARCDEFDVLLVYDEDRFTRDPLHLGILLLGFKDEGVEVWSVLGGQYDLDGLGYAIHTLRATFAKQENAKRRERAMRGQRQKVQNGLLLGSSPRAMYGWSYLYETRPDGKRFKTGRAEVDEAEAAIVRECFERALGGETPSQISRSLNDRGVPTAYGKDERFQTSGRWSDSSVLKLLRSPEYAGDVWALVHKRKSRKGSIYIDRSEGVELPEDTMPPLVDRETFEQVQFILDKRRLRPTGFSAESDVWVRGGIAKCGVCGSNLVLAKGKGGRSYLKCSRSGRGEGATCGKPSPTIKTDILEPAVWSLLRSLLLDPAKLYDRYTSPEQAGLDERRLADLRTELAGVETRRTRLLRSLEVLDEADLGDVKDRLAELGEQRDSLNRRIERAEGRIAERNIERSRIERLAGWLEGERSRVDGLTPAERRAAALQLGLTVRVFPTSAEERYVVEVGSRPNFEAFFTDVDWPSVGEPTPEQRRETALLQESERRRGEAAIVIDSLLQGRVDSVEPSYIKDYLACVASIDDNVGRVLDYLDADGIADDTIVIYTSDQGFFLGDHGWFDKRFMYEESLRMPFLMRYPREIAAGTCSDAVMTNVDFAPTFLDYAGLPASERMQGRSFRTIVGGEPEPEDWPEAMYYRYWMHRDRDHHTTAHYGIRTRRYKLIYYYGDPLDAAGANGPRTEPEWELFDLDVDPMEMRSVYDDPAYADVVSDLTEELHRMQAEVGDQPYVVPEQNEATSHAGK